MWGARQEINGLGGDSKDTTIYNQMDHVSGFRVLFPKEHRKVEREPTTLNSVLRFSHKASFFLLFLLCFFISRARNGGQQLGVGVHVFIVRLDHRRVSSAHAGVTWSGRRGGAPWLGGAADLVLPPQRGALPVEHLCVFILFPLILFLILQLCGQNGVILQSVNKTVNEFLWKIPEARYCSRLQDQKQHAAVTAKCKSHSTLTDCGTLLVVRLKTHLSHRHFVIISRCDSWGVVKRSWNEPGRWVHDERWFPYVWKQPDKLITKLKMQGLRPTALRLYLLILFSKMSKLMPGLKKTVSAQSQWLVVDGSGAKFPFFIWRCFHFSSLQPSIVETAQSCLPVSSVLANINRTCLVIP